MPKSLGLEDPSWFRKKVNVSLPFTMKSCIARILSHAEIAPELFSLDDEGFAVPSIEGDIPIELEGKAREVSQRCPEFAIEIIDS